MKVNFNLLVRCQANRVSKSVGKRGSEFFFYHSSTLTLSICFADTSSQQGCIVKVYNRPRGRPYIKRCSENRGRHHQDFIHIDTFVLRLCGVSSFTRVFDWLANYYGSLFPMPSCAIFHWVLLY